MNPPKKPSTAKRPVKKVVPRMVTLDDGVLQQIGRIDTIVGSVARIEANLETAAGVITENGKTVRELSKTVGDLVICVNGHTKTFHVYSWLKDWRFYPAAFISAFLLHEGIGRLGPAFIVWLFAVLKVPVPAFLNLT